MTLQGPDHPPRKNPPERNIIDAEFLKVAERLAEESKKAEVSIDDPYFSNIPATEREQDKKKGERMRAENAAKETPEEHYLSTIARAMEFVVVERINKQPSRWLGDDVYATLTTAVDDILNGIDLYFVKVTDGVPVGVASDITYTKDAAGLRGKIRNIKDKLLDQGRLARLKYYKPLGKDTVAGSPTSISMPKVINGVMRDKAMDMITRYAKHEQPAPDAVTGLIILNQIRMQLQHYIFYAKYISRKEKGKAAAANAIPAYEEALQIQNELFEAKLQSLPPKFPPDIVRAALNADPLTKMLREILDQELPIEDRLH